MKEHTTYRMDFILPQKGAVCTISIRSCVQAGRPFLLSAEREEE